VFGNVSARLRTAIARAATAVREALRPAPLATGFVADLFRSRDELLAENALLRQQLIVASRKVKQPKFRPFERGLVVALSSVVTNWQNRTGRVHVVDESSEVDEHDRRSSAVNAILLVKPDTVVRWHRAEFRLLWKWRSKPTQPRQPRIPSETIELIPRSEHTHADVPWSNLRGQRSPTRGAAVLWGLEQRNPSVWEP
jgi:hypothetical protein